jgi:hypothetical protein
VRIAGPQWPSLVDYRRFDAGDLVPTKESYGFRTYRVPKLALYRTFGMLPEPESAHDFF